jgi:predicted phage terminase large subunit-like protein
MAGLNMNFSGQAIQDLPRHIPVDTPLWTFKLDSYSIDKLSQADPYTFSSQYQQCPSPAAGGMFKDSYFKYYDVLPSDISVVRIYGDTAQKVGEHNDFSVFQCWGYSRNSGIYLIDQCRGKWEAPELERALLDFWAKHKPSIYKPKGAQCVKIEDKSSGSSLIQSIQRDYNIPIDPIQRNRDKVLRAMGVIKYFSSGYIHLPQDAEFLHDYKDEFRKFTPTMTHKHDDQIDPTMDAVEDLLILDNMWSESALA